MKNFSTDTRALNKLIREQRADDEGVIPRHTRRTKGRFSSSGKIKMERLPIDFDSDETSRRRDKRPQHTHD